MKIKGLVGLMAVAAIMLASCAKNSIQSSKLKSNLDSVSYAFGIVNYNALIADSIYLDPNLVAKAMMDGEAGNPKLTDDDARSCFGEFLNAREAEKIAKQAAANKILYKDYIEQNETFLANNKEKKGVIVTPSGLQYEVIKMGSGPKPTLQNTVRVNYKGTLIDGTEFDSSMEDNQPAEFRVGGVIPGWSEVLQLMPVGSKFKVYLPSDLAYGANGAGNAIKPFSTLIFDVELLDIVK